jgi:hypothetical protein
MKRTTILILLLIALAGTSLMVWQLGLLNRNKTVVTTNFPTGVVNQCRQLPGFMHTTGLGAQVAIDTRQEGYMGIRLVNAQGKHWQHPSWDDAGHVGAFDRDNKGNIYVAPSPDVSLEDNPPELQNRLYVIDAKTAEMHLFMELPADSLPSTENPFGTMGMAFDCNTNSLYVSTLAGSTRQAINGKIFQIDPISKQIKSTLDVVDAIGVGVFNDKEQKRLYYGEARSSNVFSVLLDGKGGFIDDRRYEFSLATLKGGNTTSARKIQFKKRGDNAYWMIVKEMEFGFRLPAENNPYKNQYIFEYRKSAEHQSSESFWKFLGVQQE